MAAADIGAGQAVAAYQAGHADGRAIAALLDDVEGIAMRAELRQAHFQRRKGRLQRMDIALADVGDPRRPSPVPCRRPRRPAWLRRRARCFDDGQRFGHGAARAATASVGQQPVHHIGVDIAQLRMAVGQRQGADDAEDPLQQQRSRVKMAVGMPFAIHLTTPPTS